MAYRLQSGETLHDGIRRIVREQLEHAADSLTGADVRRAGVHEARKCFKRARAALRLVRDELGDDHYRAENVCLRDAGRKLSQARDSWAFVETLDGLAARFADLIAANAFEPVRERLVWRHETISIDVLDGQGAAADVHGTIATALRREVPAPMVRDDFAALEGGLRRVYRRGYRRRREARDDPTSARLHEWRKRVKYLRYQCAMLQPLWPPVVGEINKQADKLGELLGDDHDLAELRRALLVEPELCVRQARLQVLIGLIDQRRIELQARAMPLGARLYAEPPAAFVRRVAAYWAAWRTDPTSAREQMAAAESSPPGRTIPEVAADLHRLSGSVRELFDPAGPTRRK